MECDTGERRALKEHINIPGKERERERERQRVDMRGSEVRACVRLRVGGTQRVACVHTYQHTYLRVCALACARSLQNADGLSRGYTARIDFLTLGNSLGL